MAQEACRRADGRPAPDFAEASLAAASRGSWMILMCSIDAANVSGSEADASSVREDMIVDGDDKADRTAVVDPCMKDQLARKALMEDKAVVDDVFVAEDAVAGVIDFDDFDAAGAAVPVSRRAETQSERKVRRRCEEMDRGRVVVVVSDPSSR